MSATPLDRLFLALADGTRRAVLARLAAGPASVGELAEPFDMAMPSFLDHIRRLEDLGLIETEKQGRTRICRLRPGALAPARAWMADQRQLWEDRTDRLEALLAELQQTPKSDSGDTT
ncbi:metalloregulator ArsR/SmtB family transcription factor [Rhodobacterales bacterium HKCCE3408]|nr:metalloregulator ArsR/SmtB family transcription factor [Rhodobacterales bacterium HKCCE3408]